MRRSFAHMAPLALTALCTIAVHQHPAAATPVPDAKAEVQRLMDRPINAALLYHRLWTNHSVSFAPFDEIRREADFDFDDPEWAPDEPLQSVLENMQPYIRGLMAAAAQPEADWGIEYHKGFEALLPHLSQLHRAALALRADARRLAAAGDDEAAADRVVALFRMSTQSRRDGLLICALFKARLATMASMEARILAVVYEINNDARRSLLRAIDALPVEDRHGIEYAVAIEPPFFADYIRRTFNDERPGEKIIESLMIEDEADIAWFRALTRSSLERELELYEQFGREAVKAWNDPEVLVRLGELSRKLESGEYGQVAKHLAPAFTRVRQQAERAERDLQRARAALLQEDD